MTKKTLDLKAALVRAFADIGSYAGAARRLGMSRMTVIRWLAASAADEDAERPDSEWLFEFDGVEDYLHNHMRAHLDAAVEDVEAGLIKMAVEGYWQPRSFQGRTVYKLNPQLLGWTDEEMKMCGYTEADRYLRDAAGNALPEMEHIAPSVERQLAVLAAHSDKWKKKSSVDVNQHIEGGVMVMHRVGQQPSKELPQSEPLPQIEVLPSGVIDQIVDDVEAEPVALELSPELVPAHVTAPQPSAEARRATNPGAPELLALAAMSPEERAAVAARRNKVR